MDTVIRKKWIARIFEISVVLFSVVFTQVLAYEPEETHMPLTQLAVERSVVSSVGFLARLGLTYKDPFVNSKNETQDTHTLLILDGALFEDTLTRVEGSTSDPELGSYRMFTHFYDPQNEGRGLDVFYEFGKPSIDWAITDSGVLYITPPFLPETSNYRQAFSYADAKNYLMSGLLSDSWVDRNRGMNLMFQSLGHVVHHIQDMSQPQHVRNDAHLPEEDDYYESYIKKYDIAGLRKIIEIENPHYDAENLVIVLPRIADYWDWDSDAIDRGEDRIGLAEFASTNFISDDKNFSFNPATREIQAHPEFPLPNEGQLALPLTTEFLTRCKRPNSGFLGILLNRDPVVTQLLDPYQLPDRMQLVESPVFDGYYPPGHSRHDTINRTASSFSLWSYDLGELAVGNPGPVPFEMFQVNDCVFDERLQYLLPKAVSYSAGALNHFFRGKIEITPPDSGLYGFLDLNSPHGLNESGRTIHTDGGLFGYQTITAKVRNSTPDIVVPDHFDGPTNYPQDMFLGELHAIVKYELNHCYQSDGSGEFAPDQNLHFSQIEDAATLSGCSASKYFSNREGLSSAEITELIQTGKVEIGSGGSAETVSVQQISVSNPLVIAAADGADLPEVPKDVPAEMTFQFTNDQVIPANAINVKLQLLYSGHFGPKDPSFEDSAVDQTGVAVSTIDISEPSIVTVANATDVAWRSRLNSGLTISKTQGASDQLPTLLDITFDASKLRPGFHELAVDVINSGDWKSDPIYSELKVDLTIEGDFALQYSPLNDPSTQRELKLHEDDKHASDHTVNGDILISLKEMTPTATFTEIDRISYFLDDDLVDTFITQDAPYYFQYPVENGSATVSTAEGAASGTEALRKYRFDTEALSDGDHRIRVGIAYMNGDVEEIETKFVVHNQRANHPPEMGSIPDIRVSLVQYLNSPSSTPYVFPFTATDQDGDTVNLRLDSFHRPLSDYGSLEFVSTGDGAAELRGEVNYQGGTPDNPTTGSFYPSIVDFVVTATDSKGLSVSEDVVMRLTGPRGPNEIFTDDRLVFTLGADERDTQTVGVSASNGQGDVDYELPLFSWNQRGGNTSLESSERFEAIDMLVNTLHQEWEAAAYQESNLNPDGVLRELVAKQILNSDINYGDELPLAGAYIEHLQEKDGLDLRLTVSNNNFNSSVPFVVSDLSPGQHIRFSYLGEPNAQYDIVPTDFDVCSRQGGAVSAPNAEGSAYVVSDRAYQISSDLYGSAKSPQNLACQLVHHRFGDSGLFYPEEYRDAMSGVFQGINISGVVAIESLQ